MERKLGRLPKAHDPRTLRLSKYMAAVLADPPVKCLYAQKIGSKWPVHLNDQIGDCAIASTAHAVQGWNGNNSRTVILADNDVLKAYEDVSGYNPHARLNRDGSNPTDTGCVMLNVLKYWKKTGIGGHKVDAYAVIRPSNHRAVMQALYLFGGLYVGVALPVAAEQQLNSGRMWTVPVSGRLGRDYQPGSWGGHAIYVPDYAQTGLNCITWGALQGMSWQWWDAYVDECYAILPLNDWVSGASPAPNGFDLATLQADLAAVTG